MQKNASNFPFVTFVAVREHLDEDGIWNPGDNAPPLKGAVQVNVFGKREHYLRLAEALRAFAERDVSKHGDDHDHFEGLMSVDGDIRVHLILRIGDSVAGSGWEDFYPPNADEA